MDNMKYRDLKLEDLAVIDWAGDKLHLEYLAKHIELAKSGDYEIVCGLKNKEIVVVGGIDYLKYLNFGTFWMVNVKDEYQGQGIGSKFFSELEERVNEKGIGAIRLLVEKTNPRAKKLYLKLGYVYIKTFKINGKFLTQMAKHKLLLHNVTYLRNNYTISNLRALSILLTL